MITLLTTKPQKDYELLDSGENMKLERYGSFVFSRPDPQAVWKKNLPASEWRKADFTFDASLPSKWRKKQGVPEEFNISLLDLSFKISPTAFKHTGLFPEQFSNWQWIGEKVKGRQGAKVLNLFGYTGGATVAASKAGADVVHVDASKPSIGWARDNAKISGLEERPIRYILDDAFAFVKREKRRGNHYDGIVMDPPSFERGPKGEVWKIEEKLLELVEDAKSLLSEKPLFFILNGYAAGYSPLAYKELLRDLSEKYGGSIEYGELGLEDASGRVLPAGIFSRWGN